MTHLRELVSIPTEVHKSDFVMSLDGGVSEVEATVNSYVVTLELAECFDWRVVSDV